MSVRKPSRQQIRKLYDGQCFFCEEDNYALLDAHRIHPGRDGGKYVWLNVLTVCSCCHRLIESGQIEVLGRFLSTSGDYVLQVKRDGKEEFLWPPGRGPRQNDSSNNGSSSL